MQCLERNTEYCQGENLFNRPAMHLPGQQPALLNNSDGSREPCYMIEDRGYDQVVIMKPWTPTPFAGSLLIVNKSQVEILPLSLDEFSLSLTHFGLGLADQIAEHSPDAFEKPNE